MWENWAKEEPQDSEVGLDHGEQALLPFDQGRLPQDPVVRAEARVRERVLQDPKAHADSAVGSEKSEPNNIEERGEQRGWRQRKVHERRQLLDEVSSALRGVHRLHHEPAASRQSHSGMHGEGSAVSEVR